MTSVKTAISVTIVSTDTALLHDLAWTLASFGYSATTSSNWSNDAVWLPSAGTRIILLDGRDAEHIDRAFARSRDSRFEYCIVMRPQTPGGQSERLLAAGADDLIVYPVNACELLSRLRAAVRRLEFERRMSVLANRDPQSGLLSKARLVQCIESLRNDASDVRGYRLLAVTGDHIELLRGQYGEQAVRGLSRTLGRCLAKQGCQDNCASVGECRFVALVRSSAPDECHKLFDRLQADLQSSETLTRKLHICPSITAVSAPVRDDASISDQIDRCIQMLNHARSFGGDVLLDFDELQSTMADWKAGMEAGTPIDNVAACDVMEAFPLVMRDGESGNVAQIVATFNATGEVATLPPCIPIVDGSEALIGMIDPGGIASPECAGRLVTNKRVLPIPATVCCDQAISEVFDAFAQHDCDLLVVVDNNRPRGYVTREGLASLVVDPIDSGTYFDPLTKGSSVRRLIVPLVPCKAGPQGVERETVFN